VEKKMYNFLLVSTTTRKGPFWHKVDHEDDLMWHLEILRYCNTQEIMQHKIPLL